MPMDFLERIVQHVLRNLRQHARAVGTVGVHGETHRGRIEAVDAFEVHLFVSVTMGSGFGARDAARGDGLARMFGKEAAYSLGACLRPSRSSPAW